MENCALESVSCKTCGSPVEDIQEALQCEGCKSWFHLKCITGVSRRAYNIAVENNENIAWLCRACTKPSGLSRSTKPSQISDSSKARPRSSAQSRSTKTIQRLQATRYGAQSLASDIEDVATQSISITQNELSRSTSTINDGALLLTSSIKGELTQSNELKHSVGESVPHTSLSIQDIPFPVSIGGDSVSLSVTGSEGDMNSAELDGKRSDMSVDGHNETIPVLVEAYKGGCRLLYCGHSYVQDRSYKDKTYWRCVQRSTCKARLQTSLVLDKNSIPEIVKEPTEHAHTPSINRYVRNQELDKLRKHVRLNPMQPLAQLYENVMSDSKASKECLPTQASVITILKRERAVGLPDVSKARTNIILEGDCAKTK